MSILPKVSVVIPCLNRADLLRPTIESALQQDYPNVECIVIDAASKDGTVEILESYGDRIKWVSEPDEGHADAINKGWISITRPWHLLTTNSGAGDPRAASAEKGRRMMDLLVERLSAFLVELSAAKIDERFPY